MLPFGEVVFGAENNNMSPLRPYCASSTRLPYTRGVASSIPQKSYVPSRNIHGYDCTSAVSYDWVGNGGVAHGASSGSGTETGAPADKVFTRFSLNGWDC